MPVVTGLRPARTGVEVELDGERWRTLPAAVVLAAGLGVGEELDRPRLRLLARELRRAEALGRAARALRRRDLSRQGLEVRLARGGVREPERRQAIETLVRAGIVDDARYACSRAESLAGRGFGDEAVRWRLGEEGVPELLAAEAVAALEPEHERAARIVARRGPGPATARYLAARGFGEDAARAAVEALGADG
jgi:regulatory protein